MHGEEATSQVPHQETKKMKELKQAWIQSGSYLTESLEAYIERVLTIKS